MSTASSVAPQPPDHGHEPAGRRQREGVLRRAGRAEHRAGFVGGGAHLVEQRFLFGVQADLLHDLRKRPSGDAAAGLVAQFLHAGIAPGRSRPARHRRTLRAGLVRPRTCRRRSRHRHRPRSLHHSRQARTHSRKCRNRRKARTPARTTARRPRGGGGARHGARRCANGRSAHLCLRAGGEACGEAALAGRLRRDEVVPFAAQVPSSRESFDSGRIRLQCGVRLSLGIALRVQALPAEFLALQRVSAMTDRRTRRSCRRSARVCAAAVVCLACRRRLCRCRIGLLRVHDATCGVAVVRRVRDGGIVRRDVVHLAMRSEMWNRGMAWRRDMRHGNAGRGNMRRRDATAGLAAERLPVVLAVLRPALSGIATAAAQRQWPPCIANVLSSHFSSTFCQSLSASPQLRRGPGVSVARWTGSCSL